jgi:hypothetical protein
MKREYVSPRCEVTDYELRTFILANSVPQNTPARRDVNDGSANSTKEWGNLW